MRPHRVVIVLAGAAAACCAAPLAASAVPAAAPAARAGTWGTAIEVPGLGSLNKGGDADLMSVSCSSAGNCVAGGGYTDRFVKRQGFVVSETNGSWRMAIRMPGRGTLNKGGFASVSSVSCASAGNCAAGGRYVGGSGHLRAFVVSERNGAWGKAIQVPAPSAGAAAVVVSVSCGSAGHCAAGGFYANGYCRAFVVSERNGAWGKAIEVPGSSALNKGGLAQVLSVSCGTAGNCAAGGFYTDGHGHGQAFVVSERKGRWGEAIEVPGSRALNAGGFAQVNSVSCASAGNCAAGGDYTDGHRHQQAFVISEQHGMWGEAIRVPGSGALNAGGNAQVNSVSCPSAGNCVAGGSYTDGSNRGQAFVVSERNGRWGKAIAVPGLGSLNKGGSAQVFSLSCPSAGTCAAGGSYRDGHGHRQVFVVSQA
jgi:hypothetical protein